MSEEQIETEQTEQTIYSKRLFLSDEGGSLAATAASVTTTAMGNGRKYLDVNLTITDSDGDKVYLGFWNYDYEAEVKEAVVLHRLRDVLDELIAAVAEAKAYCGEF